MVKSATSSQRDADLKLASGAQVRKAPAAADEEYVRIDYFARYFAVSTKTARAWVNQGKVESIKLTAKAIRIPKKELTRLALEGTRPARDCA